MKYNVPAWAFLAVVLLNTWFTMWAIVVDDFGLSYLFTNLICITLGFTALLVETSFKAIGLYILVTLFSILNDCLTMGWFTDDNVLDNGTGAAYNQYRFAFAFALINIVCKLVYLGVAYFEFMVRGGSVAAFLGAIQGRQAVLRFDDEREIDRRNVNDARYPQYVAVANKPPPNDSMNQVAMMIAGDGKSDKVEVPPGPANANAPTYAGNELPASSGAMSKPSLQPGEQMA